jgi:uncharacterized membrane protein
MTTNAFTPRVRLEHVIAFSDSVFAFAITLMALSIDTPNLTPNLTQSELIQKLIDAYPQLESYLISFFVISIFWISYHQVFNHIKNSTISMIYLNLLFLLLITLLSISTSLVITFDSFQISYILYSSIVIMTSMLLSIIWWHSTKELKLVDKNLHPLYIKGVMVNLITIQSVFFVSILISFVNLNIAQYFWLIIAPITIVIRHKYKH